MKTIDQAAKSSIREIFASISGGKSHRVLARDLLEEAETEVEHPAGPKFENGRWVPRYRTIVLPAGTTIYLRPICGTVRSAGGWKVYSNSYRETDSATCAKCAG